MFLELHNQSDQFYQVLVRLVMFGCRLQEFHDPTNPLRKIHGTHCISNTEYMSNTPFLPGILVYLDQRIRNEDPQDPIDKESLETKFELTMDVRQFVGIFQFWDLLLIPFLSNSYYRNHPLHICLGEAMRQKSCTSIHCSND